MDRRNFIKAAGAVSLLPMLPAIAPASDKIKMTRGPEEHYYGQTVLDPAPPSDVPGEWHHFAIARCPEDFKFYVDGELVAENMIIEPSWSRGQIWADLSDGLRKIGTNYADIWAKETEFRFSVGDGTEIRNTVETERSELRVS